MEDTPKGLRLHIGVFGRRNVGKSSLVNALIGQAVSIVSPTPGTTTDPVEKAFEIQPLGPVLFIDTAGVDDEGALGALRREKTEKVLDRADLALLVAGPEPLGDFETQLIVALRARGVPFLVAFNKADLAPPPAADLARLAAEGIPALAVSALSGEGIAALKAALAARVPEGRVVTPHLLGDLVPPGGVVVLVVPIDLGAPKGRLILPQVMAIRDVLDSDAFCLVAKERELRAAFAGLSRPPDLVVCDSQVVLKTAADTPPGVPLTTFSILMARLKGDLARLAEGAAAIHRLRPGDRVLISEACSHHPLPDDIGRVKIPRWLRQYAGGGIEVDVVAGGDFPQDLSAYALIVHCGACMINRRQMLARIEAARTGGVPITNYGVAISLVQGVLPRVLGVFPAALAAYRRALPPEGGAAAV
ncbi:[FeFe] hydrogenase H-cluster maturation GTPase HydF [Oleispirillum naphthae]|uniref:[FeFe] hydrogenase H-cluster maturation GTPase HydF n=1 Tax=Oleispirillum naphthae TaxID=2838853 RepID=UPI0030822CE6